MSRTSQAKAHPVDTGWAWAILLGSFGNHFLSIGYIRSFGMLFVEFQAQFGSSSAMTSAISGVQCCFYSLTTLFVVNVLMKRVSVRTICLTGSLVEALSVASSGFVPEIPYLLITHGVLYGMGQALLFCPTLVLLSTYFEKRRPIATVIATCGVSAGGIAFPPITRYLVDKYGLRGGLLLLSTLMLQQAVCSSLFTPPSDYYFSSDGVTVTDQLNSSGKEKVVYDNDQGIISNTGDPSHQRYTKALLINSHLSSDENNELSYSLDHSQNVNKQITPPTIGEHKPFLEKIDDTENMQQSLKSQDKSPISDKSGIYDQEVPTLKDSVLEALSTSSVDLYGSLNSLKLPGAGRWSLKQQEITRKVLSIETRQKRRCCRIPTLMKSVSFWLVALFFAGGGIGSALPVVFIPPLVKERDLHEYASLYLMVSAVTEIIGRLIPGVVLHFGWMRPTTVVIGPLVVGATLYQLTRFFSDFGAFMSMAVMTGLFTGSFWVVQSLVVIEVFGFNQLGPALGFYCIVLGFSTGTSYPIGGFLRDLSGSYSATFHYFGAMYYLAALMMVIVQFTKRNIEDEFNAEDLEEVDEVIVKV